MVQYNFIIWRNVTLVCYASFWQCKENYSIFFFMDFCRNFKRTLNLNPKKDKTELARKLELSTTPDQGERSQSDREEERTICTCVCLPVGVYVYLHISQSFQLSFYLNPTERVGASLSERMRAAEPLCVCLSVGACVCLHISQYFQSSY